MKKLYAILGAVWTLLLLCQLGLQPLSAQTCNNVTRDRSFPGTDARVLCTVIDGNMLYIGGEFQNIFLASGSGGVTVSRGFIARINLVTNTLDNSWTPRVNGRVASMAISNNRLYIGGDFTTATGNNGSTVPRNFIAAINKVTGNVVQWNVGANTSSLGTNGGVYSLLLHNNKLYLGGLFTRVGGQGRTAFAQVNAVDENPDGSVTNFNPNLSGLIVRTIRVVSNQLFIGGDFASVSGQSRQNGASFYISNLALTPFNPRANSEILDYDDNGSQLFVSGGFTEIGNAGRNRVAAFNLADYSLSGFNPNIESTSDVYIDGKVPSIELDQRHNILYMGGNFDYAGGNKRDRIAAVNITNGRYYKWRPVNEGERVRTMIRYGDNLIVGGPYSSLIGATKVGAGGGPYAHLNKLSLATFTGFCDEKPSITGTGTTLCPGQSITLTSSSSSENFWSTGERTQSITVTRSGNYTVSVQSSCCIGQASDAYIISNAPVSAVAAPVISATGPTAVCANRTVRLNSTASNRNQWYLDGNILTGDTLPSYRARVSGVYTVKIPNPDPQGCEIVSNSITVSIATPFPSNNIINASGDVVFCPGGSVALTAPAGYRYRWSNGDTTQAINVNTSGAYAVSLISGVCTSGISPATVVSASLPVPSKPTITQNGTTTFCAGGSITLTAPAGFGYIWNNGATSQTITVTTSGSYSVRVVSNKCTSVVSDPVAITVNPAPTIPIIAQAGPHFLNNGASVTLVASGGTSYKWSNGSTTASITVSAAGTYYVESINGSCSTRSALVYVYNTASLTTYTVDRLSDNGSGSGNTGDLRYCINKANANVDATDASPTLIQIGIQGLVTLTSNLPGVTRPMIIKSDYAKASNFTVDGNNTYGVWTNNTNLSLKRISLYRFTGPAIHNQSGVLNVSECYIRDCLGEYDGGYSGVKGSGVAVSAGTVLISGSTIAGGRGSGVRSYGGTITLSKSTLYNNNSYVGGGAWFSGSNVVIDHCTFDNLSDVGGNNGDDIYSQSGNTLSLSNSIFAYADDGVFSVRADHSISLNVRNIIDTYNGNIGTPFSSNDPLLSPLFDNGGPVPTMAINSSSSVAVNNASSSINTDGRGFAVVGVPDIGAYEFGAVGVTCTEVAPVISTLDPLTPCAGQTVSLASSIATNNQWYKDNVLITNATGPSYLASTSGVYFVKNTSLSCNPNSNTIQLTFAPAIAAPVLASDTAVTICQGASTVLKVVSIDTALVETYAGTGSTGSPSIGQRLSVSIGRPNGVFADSSGDIYLSTSQRLSKVATNGDVSEISTDGNFGSIAISKGLICVARNSRVYFYDKVTGVYRNETSNFTSLTSGLTAGTTSTGQQLVFVSSEVGGWIRSFEVPAAHSNLVATGLTNPRGLCMDGPNHLLVVEGTGKLKRINITTLEVVEIPIQINLIGGATLASINGLSGVAVDQEGNIFVSTYYGGYILNVSRNGASKIVAGTGNSGFKNGFGGVVQFDLPKDLTIAQDGSLIIADHDNQRLRRLTFQPSATYLWSNNQSGSEISVSEAGSFTVRQISGTCTSAVSKTIRVTVTPTPATLSISGNTSICSGSSTTLTASSGAGYLWSNGETTRSINVSTLGVYYVQQVSSGCTSVISSPVAVEVGTTPATPTIASTGTTLPCTGVTILEAEVGDNFIWSSGDTTASIKVRIPGTYSVRAINGRCTSAVSQSITITLPTTLPAPTITTIGATSLSCGSRVVIKAAGGFNYLWSDGTVGDSLVVTNPGTYTAQNFNGICTSAVSSPIVVPLLVLPTINLSSNSPVNQNQTLTISATDVEGAVYAWSGVPKVENGETSTFIAGDTSVLVFPNASPLNSGKYYVTVRLGNCVKTDSINVVVNCLTRRDTLNVSICPSGQFSWYSTTYTSAGLYSTTTNNQFGCQDVHYLNLTTSGSAVSVPKPLIAASGPLTFCEGDSITLSVPFDGSYTYDWNDGSTNQLVVKSSGTYIVNVFNPQGCNSISDPITLTMVPFQALPVVAASDTVVCAGGSVNLATTATGVREWLRDGQVIGGESGQQLSATQSGLYKVRVRNVSGCYDTSRSVAVTIKPLPTTPTVTPSGPTTFCTGGSVTLSAPAGFTYLWSTTETSQSINVTAGGSYTVRTIANGCTSSVSAATVVTVNTPPTTPTISAGGPTTFCTGGSVTLTAPAGFSYLWSTTETSQSINVTAGGSYTVRTIANGCTSAISAATVVTVNTPPTTPTINEGGPTTFCTGGSVTLTAPAGFTYLWSTNETSQSINVTAGGSYTVRTIANGCTSSVSAATVVTVNTPPTTPTISAGGPTTFCTGGSVTLSAPAGFSYLWSTTETSQSVNVTAGGSYTVRTIANGCTSAVSAATVVTVNTPPSTPTINAGGSTTFCIGGSVTLSAPAGFTYLWSNSATTQSINVTAGGSYTVQTISNGCTSSVSTATVVTVNTPPTTPTISASGPTTFNIGGSVTLTAPAGFAYIWSNNETSQSIVVTTAGNYSVKTILNGCTSTTSVATVVRVNTVTTFIFKGTGQWTNLARWSSGILPGVSDSATVDSGAVATVVSGFEVKSLLIRATASLNVQSPSALVTVRHILNNLGSISVSTTGTAGFIVGGGTLVPAIIKGNKFGLNTLRAASNIRLESDLDIRSILDPNGKTIDFNNKRITLKSSSAGTGQLLQPVGTIIQNATNFTVERYMAPSIADNSGAWVWVGAQTQGQKASLWSQNNRYDSMTYIPQTAATRIRGSVWTMDPRDTSRGFNGYQKPLNANQSAPVGTGHRVWFRSNDFFSGAGGIWRSTGSPKIGSHVFPLLHCGGANCAALGTAIENGWNLIANPYAATIDWDAATGWTKSFVFDNVRIHRHKFGNASAYVGGVGVNGGSRYIPSGQGFMVWADSAISTLSINPSAIAATQNPSIQRQGIMPDVLKLNIVGAASNYLQDQVAIRWDANANAGFDQSLEAHSMVGNNGINLSFMLGQTPMAIMAEPTPTTTTSYPLALSAPQAGTYTITFEGLASLSNPQWSIYLLDNQTGISTLVTDAASYAFSAVQGANNGRFSLVVDPAGVTSLNAAISNKVLLSPNPATSVVTLQLAQAMSQATTFSLTNAVGQVVLTATMPANTTKLSIDLSSLAKGVYMVQAPGLGVTKLVKE